MTFKLSTSGIVIIFFFFFPILAEASREAAEENKVSAKNENGLAGTNTSVFSGNRSLKIQSIVFQSANQKLNKKLNKKFGRYIGKASTQKNLNEIEEKIKSNLLKKRILTPELRGPLYSLKKNQVHLVYEIRDPYRIDFVIRGNNGISDYVLLKNRFRYFDHPRLMDKVKNSIIEQYSNKAIHRTTVTATEVRKDEDFIKIYYFQVKEGTQYPIQGFRLLGEFSKKDHYYIKFMKNNSGLFVKKNIFFPNGLNQGVKLLQTYLSGKGWWRAEVTYKAEFLSSGKVLIHLEVYEGDFLKTGRIFFNGNKHVSDEELMKVINSKSSQGFNLGRVKKDMDAILSYYLDEGFIDIELEGLRNTVKCDQKTFVCDLNFFISEGERFYVDSILVKGNKITDLHLILKRIPIKKGDVFTRKIRDKVVKSLMDMGVFVGVQVIPQVQTSSQGEKTRVVSVEVTERKTRSLRLAGGVNTVRYLTAKGIVEFYLRNILGRAKSLHTQLKLQSNVAQYLGIGKELNTVGFHHLEHVVLASYGDHFFLGSLFHNDLSASHSGEIFSYKKRQILNSTRLSFSLKRSWTDHIYYRFLVLGWERRHQFQKLKDEETQESPSLLNIFSTGVSLDWDRRNNLLNPTRGFSSHFSVNYSSPFVVFRSLSKMHFLKMESKTYDYTTLIDNKLVWINSVHGGVLLNFGNLHEGTGNFPGGKFFTLGGTHSLRGFDGLLDGERVPDVKEFPIAGPNTLIRVNKAYYFLIKTELRFLLTTKMQGSLFYDGGSVLVSDQVFEKPYRQSVGIGVHYMTPLGAVSGYLACKVSPKPHERLLYPHLSFGNF